MERSTSADLGGSSNYSSEKRQLEGRSQEKGFISTANGYE